MVREQKRRRAISVGESPSEASSVMCILSLRLGFISRFIALHLGDEALALLGDNGDILHVRPFLWWLDGFGVFTMPQRAAVCSIILCIYLDDPEQFDYATEHNMVMVTRNRDDFWP